MRLKGRIWIAIWLLFTLVVLAWVVTRDTSGFMTASELRNLRNQRSVQMSEKADLMRRIREAESRAVLIPRAESMGLRLPADSEIVILQAPIHERR
jgi:cell division protein FtsL